MVWEVVAIWVIVAATIVWRVVTILGTLVLGLACLVAWRSRHRGEVAAR